MEVAKWVITNFSFTFIFLSMFLRFSEQCRIEFCSSYESDIHFRSLRSIWIFKGYLVWRYPDFKLKIPLINRFVTHLFQVPVSLKRGSGSPDSVHVDSHMRCLPSKGGLWFVTSAWNYANSVNNGWNSISRHPQFPKFR